MISVRCPICQHLMQGQGPTEWPDYPFCSARCKLIDLGRWFDERYRVEAEDQDDLPPEATDAP